YFGTTEWTRMPFGLKNTSALFHMIMDALLGLVPAAACYIDDVVVFSRNDKQHVEDVMAMLAAIRAACLTCHPKKCSFTDDAVKYMGFWDPTCQSGGAGSGAST
ncbi:unnamed protein product, partial [Closterium sp. NIES-54]